MFKASEKAGATKPENERRRTFEGHLKKDEPFA